MRSDGTRKGSQIAHYDANGNLVNTGTGVGTVAYAWDADGHMIADTVNGSATATATYDAFGRMVERDQGSSSMEVVYDPTGHRLAQMTGQTLAQAYVPLPAGGPWIPAFAGMTNTSGLMYYYHPDWEGSVRLKSNTSRSVGGDAAYGPYGETYAASGGWLNVYAGIQDDFSPELDDAMLRRYNPTQGRWVSPDPLGGDVTNSSGDEPGGPQSLNRYAYVMNNPTNLTDPMGLDNIVCGKGAGMTNSCDASSPGSEGQGGGYGDNGNFTNYQLDGVSIDAGLFATIATSETTTICNVPNCVYMDSAYNNAHPENPELYQWKLDPGSITFNCTGSDPSWQSYSCSPAYWSLQFIGNAGGGLLGRTDTFYSDSQAWGLAVLGAAGREAAPMTAAGTYVGWTAGAATLGTAPGAASVSYDTILPVAANSPNATAWILQFARGLLMTGTPPTSWSIVSGKSAAFFWNWLKNH
ncbi:MAG TPA: RHS repeat-associated core domain-containing protein [Terriglobia bacterium]|nr:RHS repeat-associated core domain-containing protein [Terriglobia bacterium]